MQKRLLKQLKGEVNILKSELKTCEKILQRLNYQKEKFKKSRSNNRDFEMFSINFLIDRYNTKYYYLQNKILKRETRIYVLQNPDDDIVTTERCKVGCNILSPKKRKRIKKSKSLQKKK